MDEQRFAELWNRCRRSPEAPGDPKPVFDEVHAYYASNGRHYHTPAHIDHCLKLFDLASDHLESDDAVEMALWFHDVIYDLKAGPGRNERASADFFVARVGAAVDAAFREQVVDLIMITAHRAEPATQDERFIVDIDLSSFGLPWEEFRRDSVAVREEYPHLSDRDFYAKQCAFLHALVDREHFCYTRFFRERHEARARSNISRYLDELESLPGD